MPRFNSKLLRWLSWVILACALFFLASAFYIPAKALLAQQLLQQAWQQTLADGEGVRPWPWADTWPVARLRIPTIAVDQIVLQGAHGHALAFAPGQQHIVSDDKQTNMTVISAHRDTHFRSLEQVSYQDVIELQDTQGVITRYRVQEIHIVNAKHTGLNTQLQGHWLTLVTCYPFNALDNGGPLRYVIFAKAINDCTSQQGCTV